MTLLTRRQAFLGLIAAPAIIKLAPLMRIKPLPLRTSIPEVTWRKLYNGHEMTGFVPSDWRYAVQIANIDTSPYVGLGGLNPDSINLIRTVTRPLYPRDRS